MLTSRLAGEGPGRSWHARRQHLRQARGSDRQRRLSRGAQFCVILARQYACGLWSLSQAQQAGMLTRVPGPALAQRQVGLSIVDTPQDGRARPWEEACHRAEASHRASP